MPARLRSSQHKPTRKRSCGLLLRLCLQKLLGAFPILSRKWLLRNQLTPVFDVAIKGHEPPGQQNEGTEPQQVGSSIYRRVIKNEITVAFGQKGHDLFISLAGLHLFANLLA